MQMYIIYHYNNYKHSHYNNLYTLHTPNSQIFFLFYYSYISEFISMREKHILSVKFIFYMNNVKF